MKKKLIVTCVVLLGGASGLVAAAERSSAPSYDFVVVEERCGLRPEAGRAIGSGSVRCIRGIAEASVRCIRHRAPFQSSAMIDEINSMVRFPS